MDGSLPLIWNVGAGGIYMPPAPTFFLCQRPLVLPIVGQCPIRNNRCPSSSRVLFSQKSGYLLPIVHKNLFFCLSEPMICPVVWIRHPKNIPVNLRTSGRHSPHHSPPGFPPKGPDEIVSRLSPPGPIHYPYISARADRHGAKPSGNGGLTGFSIRIDNSHVHPSNRRNPIDFLRCRNRGVILLYRITGV